MHAFHSAVKDGLQMLDDLISRVFDPSILKGFKKYYGSLAKLTNFWREQAAEIMAAWDQYHQGLYDAGHVSDDDMRALLKLGRRYPHQVVAGRWGSVEAAEEFLTERGQHNIVPVLLQVLSKSMKHDPNARLGAWAETRLKFLHVLF